MEAAFPSRARSILGLALGYVLACSVFVIWYGFRGYDREPALVVGTFLGTFALAIVAQWLGWLRSPSWSGRAIAVFVVAVPFALLAYKLAYSGLFDGSLRWWPSKPGFRCLRLSLLMGALVLIPAIVSRYGGLAVRPLATGAAFGAASGAAAWALVDLWCPVGHPQHMLLGHVLPTALLTLVGAVLGRVLLKISAGEDTPRDDGRGA